MSIAFSKRTRSQLVVPDHVLRLPLTRSPLKHAKIMSKNQAHVELNGDMEDEEELEVQDGEDEMLVSHMKNKRLPDTHLEDALSPTSYREPKRVKLDPLPPLMLSGMGGSVEDQILTSQSNRKLVKPFVRAATESACQKHTPIMNYRAKAASIFSHRARSVPLPTEPFPELDLRTLSPTRSPSKVSGQLKITIVPQVIEATPTSPLTPTASTDDAENEMDVIMDPGLANRTHPTINIEFSTPNKTGHFLQAPSSPLSPTSSVDHLPTVQDLFMASAQRGSGTQDVVVQASSSLQPVNSAESSTSTTAPSRLPRLSTSTPSVMPPPPVPVKRGRSATTTGSHTVQSKPIPNLSKGKRVIPPSSGPRRVTRSLSMKEKKPEGLNESKDLEASSHTSTFKVPTLGKSSFTGRPDPAKFRQTSLATFIKTKPLPSSSTTDSSSSTSSSMQRSLPSPSKIPLPISPSKQRVGTAAKKPVIGVFGPSKHVSSLSTLSTALEKLAMPPPSRPNTSLGFNVDPAKDEYTSAGSSMTKDDSAVTGSSATFSRPTASSLKRHATISESARVNVVGRMKPRNGASGRTATGIFGAALVRPSMKASKKTTLPSVMASPVKGGRNDGIDDNYTTTASLGDWEDNFMQERRPDVVATPPIQSDNETSKEQVEEASFIIEDLTSSIDKGKKRESWDSHRASSALHALSQSLSSLPETPPKPVVVGTRTGLRSSSSSYYGASGSGFKFVADMQKKDNIQEDINGVAPHRGVSSKNDTDASPMEGGSVGKKGALKVLKKCAIFVDVRTDDGDDAGSLFVDMLRSLGARILGRIGQSCTHIVYKNGSTSTLTRYRLLNDPKPVVVGIAWVVECVEQRSRVDEEKFKVDLELVNVSGTNKRRRSMLPKHMAPLANAVGISCEPVNLLNNDSGKRQPTDGECSPAQDTDTSFRSAKDDDDLPPLERARRRRSILPGGQTRLV